MTDDSHCTKGKYRYCSFTPVLLAPDAQVEVCVQCGKKVIYPIREGRMDNRKYARDHIRDFAQPFGATHRIFEQVYGKAGLRTARTYQNSLRARKTKDQIQQGWEETFKEADKDMRQRDEYGKKLISS